MHLICKRQVSRYILCLFILITGLTSAQSTYQVGIVIDGPWENNDPVVRMIKDEVKALMEGEFDVQIADKNVKTADWTVAGINAAIDQLMNDASVDAVVSMGVVASHIVSTRKGLRKPVIAPLILDPELQGIPQEKGTSGIKNLSYIAIPSTFERDMKAFLRICSFEKVLILMNRPLYESIPRTSEMVMENLDELPIEASIVPVGESADDALKAINNETEAVYVAPLLQLRSGEFQRLISELNERKLPTFSLFGLKEVEQGILAGLNPDIFPRLSRRIAINLQRILLKEKPSEIPFAFASGEQLSINISTARKIGVYPPWSVITEAVLLNDEAREINRRLTLRDAVSEGVEANLDLVVKELETLAAAENVALARANLLPQIDLGLTGLQIDADRAGTIQPEQTLTGKATLTQLIFSERANANYGIQKNLQKSREFDRHSVSLDIAQQIGTAYLLLLRAQTLEKIQQENLRISRSNLELARIRESIGYSGRADLHRWESQIATNRRNVISANASRNQAEIQVNRLLNRPLEENFITLESEGDGNEELLMADFKPYLKFMSNQWAFKTFRKFLVEYGLKNSPELEQLGAAIEAQRRLLKSTTRAFFLPDVAAQAEISRWLVKEGEGSQPVAVADPSLAPLLEAFDQGNDTNWSVAINLSYPLFSGGAKNSQRQQALKTLNQLETQKRSVREKIEQRIRSAAHATGASYAGINQAREAATAADKNLDLVTDAYSRGVLSITQLLDAQNAALVARQAAADAVYNFLIDLMEANRAIGGTPYLKRDEAAAFVERIEAFFEKEGVRIQ